MRIGYQHVLAMVRGRGVQTTPRGLGTRQLTGFHIKLWNPDDSLPLACGRKLNPSIAAVEAAQLIAGETWPELVVAIAPAFKEFMDGPEFHGAYGVRIGKQYEYVVTELRQDLDSRRAQITLWNPEKDNTTGFHDYPCTTSLQFIRQNGKLECHAHMRSNDVWRGFAYDVFQFTQLQYSIANAIGLAVGPYHHYAVSMHLYDNDLDAIDQCLETSVGDKPEQPLPHGLTREEARTLLWYAWQPDKLYQGAQPVLPYTPGLAWYEERLARRSTQQV